MTPLRRITVPMRARRRLCQWAFRTQWRRLRRVLPAVTYNRVRMMCKLGYWPHLHRPETLNEKITHRNLHHVTPLMSRVTDKLAVRNYVAERAGAELLTPLLHSTDDPATIPFDDLPDRYVVKANHGCGWNRIVTDPAALDRDELIEICRKWLRRHYGRLGYETIYDPIEPRILVESYIQDGEELAPRDFKFYCFHGTVRLIQYQEGRFEGLRQTFYDPVWQPTELTMRVPMADPIPPPPTLERMTEVARVLSADFDFARVDLYSPGDTHVVFGEITLSPGAGGLGLEPREWDLWLGQWW